MSHDHYLGTAILHQHLYLRIVDNKPVVYIVNPSTSFLWGCIEIQSWDETCVRIQGTLSDESGKNSVKVVYTTRLDTWNYIARNGSFTGVDTKVGGSTSTRIQLAANLASAWKLVRRSEAFREAVEVYLDPRLQDRASVAHTGVWDVL